MNETNVTVVGTVVSGVWTGETKKGLAVASFRLVTTERRYERSTGEWVDGEVTYLGVSCWRAMAENVSGSVHKGDPVVVHGKLRVRDWERDGRKGRDIEIEASSIGHDLSRGTTTFLRTQRRSVVVEAEVMASLGGSITGQGEGEPSRLVGRPDPLDAAVTASAA